MLKVGILMLAIAVISSTMLTIYGSSIHALLVSLGVFITLRPYPPTDLVKGISISTDSEKMCPCGVKEIYALIALRPFGSLAMNSL
jgi:hypothetical protein